MGVLAVTFLISVAAFSLVSGAPGKVTAANGLSLFESNDKGVVCNGETCPPGSVSCAVETKITNGVINENSRCYNRYGEVLKEISDSRKTNYPTLNGHTYSSAIHMSSS